VFAPTKPLLLVKELACPPTACWDCWSGPFWPKAPLPEELDVPKPLELVPVLIVRLLNIPPEPLLPVLLPY
jgi:hypothetical protein